jgi:hypothetical protein
MWCELAGGGERERVLNVVCHPWLCEGLPFEPQINAAYKAWIGLFAPCAVSPPGAPPGLFSASAAAATASAPATATPQEPKVQPIAEKEASAPQKQQSSVTDPSAPTSVTASAPASAGAVRSEALVWDDGFSMPFHRMSFRDVSLHNCHFSPNNCTLALDRYVPPASSASASPSTPAPVGAAPAFHAFWVVLHDEKRRYLCYHVLPGTASVHTLFKRLCAEAPSLDQFVSALDSLVAAHSLTDLQPLATTLNKLFTPFF